MLQIKVASESDLQPIVDVTLAAYEEYATKMGAKFWAEYVASIKAALANAQLTRILVTDTEQKAPGDALGAVVYCPPYEKEMGDRVVRNPFPEMRLLAIAPSARNRGIAAQLINECEERARKEGFSAITLHTTSLMVTAKSMYERRGYKRYPEIDFSPAENFYVMGYIKTLEKTA
jgi:ribosomal protein S18 acetylase RimI-like enzyme